MRHLPSALLAAGLLLLAGCGAPPSPPAPGSPSPPAAPPGARFRCAPPKILLLGLDAADPRVVAELAGRGALPAFARFAREGAFGNLASQKPMLSPILWASIATGRPPDEHGILDFLSSAPGPPRPVLSTERRAKALWNILSDAGCRVGVVGWYASHPAERVNGFIVSDRVALHSFRGGREVPQEDAGKTWPPDLLPRIEPLLASPSSIRDGDLAAAFGLGPVPPESAGRLDELRAILSQTRSYEAIGLHLLREEDPDFLAVYFEGLDTVSHLFIEYARPALRGVSRAEEAAFGAAVESFYLTMDQILGEFLQAAGPDRIVLVISDHGFLWGPERLRTRPGTSGREEDQAPRWHRDPGLIGLLGPGIAAASRPEARIDDIVPTVLALKGLPPPRDLRGRVLEEVLTPEARSRLPVETVATYEGGSAPAPEEAALPPSAGDAEAMERLRALGYVGGEDPSARGSSNLGVYYLAERRYREALLQFRAALDRDPGDYHARLNLGITLSRMGQIQAAEAAFSQAREIRPDDPVPLLLLVECAYSRRDLPAALSLAEEALRLDPENADAWVHRGSVLGRMGRTAEAERDLRRALELQPGHEEARRKLETALRGGEPAPPGGGAP